MPALAWMKRPTLWFRSQQFGRGISKGKSFARLRVCNLRCVPWPEEPFPLALELSMKLRESLPEVDRLFDHFLRQHFAGASFHHRGRDFVRGNDWIQRGRRCLKHVGFIKTSVLDGPTAAADVNVGRLR